jgi:L-ascorbate metabolism protein UlaG (beta-lactamase superfamily)
VVTLWPNATVGACQAASKADTSAKCVVSTIRPNHPPIDAALVPTQQAPGWWARVAWLRVATGARAASLRAKNWFLVHASPTCAPTNKSIHTDWYHRGKIKARHTRGVVLVTVSPAGRCRRGC